MPTIAVTPMLRPAAATALWLVWTFLLLPLQAVAVWLRLPLAGRVPRVYHRGVCRLFGLDVASREHHERTTERLEAGDSLILFPESTTGNGDRLLDFRSSFFAVAEQPIDGRSLRQPQAVGAPLLRTDRLRPARSALRRASGVRLTMPRRLPITLSQSADQLGGVGGTVNIVAKLSHPPRSTIGGR